MTVPTPLSVVATAALFFAAQAAPPTAVAAAGPGVGNLPQGTQTDQDYAASFARHSVTNVFATNQHQVSCYRPEVPAPVAVPFPPTVEGYTGETPCPGATTGEDIGTSPYPTQLGSSPGYPAAGPMQVKEHAESNLRVDPTNPRHLIGVAKWFVSAEADTNLVGFYESFDGGQTWPVTGHVPGFEGWTENTDPVGAFDGYGNYYVLFLPYQFFYNDDGSHNFATGTSQLPNPAEPAEVLAVAVRRHGATSATDWLSTQLGLPDVVAGYPTKGQAPDKPWLAIDNNPASPNYNTIYATWVVFDGWATKNSKPFVATAHANPDGTHTDWSAPQVLPTVSGTANDYYPMPQVDPSGVVSVAMQHYPSAQGRSTGDINIVASRDGGTTWNGPYGVVQGIPLPPSVYPNTTFLYDQLVSFAVGPRLSAQGHYPLYVAWEDYSLGSGTILVATSGDGGQTWSAPIQVNDNATQADEIQPGLAVAADGTVSVAFYDRRLACPAQGTAEAETAGLALDVKNANYTGSLPPYGAANYCMNASVQFYTPSLQPLDHNIRLTEHTWDPQLFAIRTGCATCTHTWLGDYFGTTSSGGLSLSSFVSTYDPGEGTNPGHFQQQVIATVRLPTGR